MCEAQNLCRRPVAQECQEKVDVQRIVRSNEEFGKNVFKIIANEQRRNIIISPFSAHCALSMVYTGADGETAKTFQTTLNLLDAKTTADEYHQFLSNILNLSSVTFKAANKIFVTEKCELAEDFQSALEKNYFGRAENVNFTLKEQSAKLINDWVKAQTNNKIKDIIKPETIDDGTHLIIINAVYFKGDWLFKFPTTEKKPFYLLDGTTREIDMMINQASFRYTEDSTLKAQIVELPYKGEEISMLVFVPIENAGIKDLENSLLHYDWNKLYENMMKLKINVWLPKFKIEYETKLNPILDKMGLSVIFSDAAQFTKMMNNKMALKVSEVIQKAFIEVNEEGTEAAASTGLRLMVKSLPSFVPTLKADHPFLFTLNLKTVNNAPFFFGRIMEL